MPENPIQDFFENPLGGIQNRLDGTPLGDYIQNPLGGVQNAINANPLAVVFNPEVMSQAGDFFVTRVLPTLAGFGIMTVGVLFVLSGTKVGQVAGAAVDLVATKGLGKIGKAVT